MKHTLSNTASDDMNTPSGDCRIVSQKHKAFTLVELSIVLVILGLLVGGVLGGQSLIRAAELRSITTEYADYKRATITFKDKYFALPGDMLNATSFWGVAAPTLTCFSAASTDTKTCDGNGDGQIRVENVNPTSNEWGSFWHHLANAQLIPGQYTGLNTPKGKAVTWLVYYEGAVNADGNNGMTMYVEDSFYGDYGNSLIIKDGLKAEEAWNIDKKMDDGKPATGKIAVLSDYDGTSQLDACTTTSSPATLTASYLLTSTQKICGLFFRHL